VGNESSIVLAEDSEVETNSGVEFPGESLEPLIGVATNLEDEELG
jgi:hypothetical protein